MTITTTTPATAHVTLEQIDSIPDAIAVKEATKVDRPLPSTLSTLVASLAAIASVMESICSRVTCAVAGVVVVIVIMKSLLLKMKIIYL